MNLNWINNANNKKLLLFFNGWGMDEKAIAHLQADDCDILMLNDYKSLELDEQQFAGYDKIEVVAWSLGVWVAAQVLGKWNRKPDNSLAINGTLNPVSSTEGIPPEVFSGTLNFWNEPNRIKFNRRVLGGIETYQKYESVLSDRSCENQKQELAWIFSAIEKEGNSSFTFEKALIGTNDQIFRPENQLTFWNGKTQIKEMELPHYPFKAFTHWNQLLDFNHANN